LGAAADEAGVFPGDEGSCSSAMIQLSHDQALLVRAPGVLLLQGRSHICILTVTLALTLTLTLTAAPLNNKRVKLRDLLIAYSSDILYPYRTLTLTDLSLAHMRPHPHPHPHPHLRWEVRNRQNCDHCPTHDPQAVPGPLGIPGCAPPAVRDPVLPSRTVLLSLT
jgi:hypothetical protein